MERNEEVQEIKQKIIICAVVFIFIVCLGLLLVFNRFGSDVDAVTQALKKKESFVVYFRDNDELCKDCSMVEQQLNTYGVSYYNFDINAPSFSNVLKKLKVDYEVKAPAVYVIEDGKVLYNITNISDKETIDMFISQNNIVNFSNRE